MTARVFLVGLYGVDNLGDEAVRAAVERAAPRFESRVHAYAVRRASGDPRAVRLRGDWRRYLRAIRASERVAIGGGGLLKDEGHALLRGYGLLLELFLTALVARALGKRVVLLAIGVGPIHTLRGRLLVSAAARLAHVRQVRDEASARVLRGLGVRDVEVTVDPTFTFFEQDRPAGRSNGRALLSIRPWFLFESDRERREAVLQESFAQAADALVAAGAEAHFANLYWPRDREASEGVIARMCEGARASLLGGPLDWDALSREMRGARLVVAMRYHAIACAAMVGAPVVAVAYEPKVSSLARALGLPELHVDDPDLGTRLTERTRAALADPDAYRPTRERAAELSREAWGGLRRALSG